MAEKADIHELYEQSVQAVDVEVEFLQDTFRSLRGREAVSLREDFCGTASFSCEWVRTGPRRHAIGVDSTPTCSIGAAVTASRGLPETARARVKLLERRRAQRHHRSRRPRRRIQLQLLLLQDARRDARLFQARAQALERATDCSSSTRSAGPRRPISEREDQDRRLHVRLGAGRVRARHEPHRLPHPLQVSRTARRSSARSPTTGGSGRCPSCASCCSKPASRRSASIGKATTAKAAATASSRSTRRASPISRGSRTSSPRNEEKRDAVPLRVDPA